MFEDLGPMKLILILVIILVLFGAKKIPDIAKSIGQGIKEFKNGIKDSSDDEKPDNKEIKK
jgi:sec-independent protein translocase protein TatA